MSARIAVFAILLFASWGLLAQEAEDSSPYIDDPETTLVPLAQRFFEWRRVQQPAGGDDIPRVERPDGWTPDYTPESLEEYRKAYRLFFEVLDEFDQSGWSTARQVDARLLRAAMQRVHWELDVLQSPYRNPLFYIDQTLGSVFELLIISTPITPGRAENIILRLEAIPATLAAARSNLDRPVRPFARAAIESLDGIDGRLERMRAALESSIPDELNPRLAESTGRAAKSLLEFSAWLKQNLEDMRTAFAIGPHSYQWFLSNVALIPNTPGELLQQGQQAWKRAVAWDAIESNRNRDELPLPLAESAERQIALSFMKENEIRSFLESRDLMTVPDWLQHYRNRLMPDHLEPLSFMGVTDDLTSETRLDEDAVSYIREPSENLPYFALSAARDPRPLLIHEGIPGHYFQLAQSWAHPNPIRRRYIDSSINEGIAFYVEELLLQAGLFDFSPRSREIIYSFMRLRALRVEVDIRLAIGDFSIRQAAEYLARAVPMDLETAMEEAVFFAFNPGQAISYEIGKQQILGFLSDARLDRGQEFSLRHFHDFLMQNGNVPVALQRWEYLGKDDHVLRLDALGGQPVTVPQ